jgi:hypothetical protein
MVRGTYRADDLEDHFSKDGSTEHYWEYRIDWVLEEMKGFLVNLR